MHQAHPDPAPRVERFDPVTGKLLPDAARFDPFTGRRLPTSPTAFWLRRPGVGSLIAHGLWLVVAAIVVAAGVAEDLHRPSELATGLAGVAIAYLVGALGITVTSYVYRRLRRLA
ncbi:MAG TPA: hypothetical protein VFI18_01365 [Gaiellales bacterium]|nr:hypothetical protein [Gaiellales bacterium]